MNKKCCIVGFGAPQTFGAHVFEVRIARDKSRVIISEQIGLTSDHADDRCEHLIDLPYNTWRGIRDAARIEFNHRLRAKRLPLGRWDFGTTKMDRLLGKELCVLAWAVLDASNKEIPHICAKWVSLRPEERWWLYGMASAEGSAAENREKGWQKALSVALSGGKGREKPMARTTKRQKPPARNGHPQFDFLGE